MESAYVELTCVTVRTIAVPMALMSQPKSVMSRPQHVRMVNLGARMENVSRTKECAISKLIATINRMKALIATWTSVQVLK
jgi:DNA-binding response OmpR family regulator